MRWGGEAFITAPMYSNPPFTSVLFGSVRSDRAAIDKHLPDADVKDVRAILVGHGHYDHLLDVPHVLDKTVDARVYGNRSVRRLLVGLTGARDASCPAVDPTQGWPKLDSRRIVALNDPAADRVDYRGCGAGASTCGQGSGAGAWVQVPNSNIRIRALCSTHPPQFLAVHFGEGCVDKPQCEPPPSAGDWKEGLTLAYLVDFLDPTTKRPVFRVFYQDAPTDAPVSHVDPALLAEKRVDVALLCVGTYTKVKDHPASIVAHLSPRYAIGGHWEDFFRKPDEAPKPLAFHDVAAFTKALGAAIDKTPSAPAAELDGVTQTVRYWVPQPGVRLSFAAQ